MLSIPISLWFLTSESDITNSKTDVSVRQQLTVLTFSFHPCKMHAHIWWEGLSGVIWCSKERGRWCCMASFHSNKFFPDSVHGNSVITICWTLHVCISQCCAVKQPVRHYKRWLVRFMRCVLCLQRGVCVYVCVTTCVTGVPVPPGCSHISPCQNLSSCCTASTACRSTFYYLLPQRWHNNNRRPTAIWQAGLASYCSDEPAWNCVCVSQHLQ